MAIKLMANLNSELCRNIGISLAIFIFLLSFVRSFQNIFLK